MNNKEFTSELAERLGYTIKDTSELIGSLLSDMIQELEVKKKAERISINPASKQRMLVPPKLVLSYKPSNTLKDKFK